jgi:hypothetical protein
MSQKYLIMQTAVMTFLIVGCDIKVSEPAESDGLPVITTIDAPFLNIEQFTAKKLATLDIERVANLIQQQKEFFAKEPEDEDDVGSEESKCLDTIDSISVKSSENDMIIGAHIDFTDCYNNLPNQEVDYSEASVKIYIEYTCSSGGLGVFNGQTYGNVASKADTWCSAATESVETNMYQMQIKFVGTFEDKIIDLNHLEMFANDQQKGCKTNLKGTLHTLEEGCLFSNLNNIDLPGNEYLLKKIKTGVMTATINDQYFQSGSMSFDFNGWKGTMAYSGATTAPTWTITSEQDAISGTFEFGSVVDTKATQEVGAPTAPTANENLSDAPKQDVLKEGEGTAPPPPMQLKEAEIPASPVYRIKKKLGVF